MHAHATSRRRSVHTACTAQYHTRDFVCNTHERSRVCAPTAKSLGRCREDRVKPRFWDRRSTLAAAFGSSNARTYLRSRDHSLKSMAVGMTSV
eukprot:2205802-Rhodomonas_salina.4